MPVVAITCMKLQDKVQKYVRTLMEKRAQILPRQGTKLSYAGTHIQTDNEFTFDTKASLPADVQNAAEKHTIQAPLEHSKL